MRLFQYEFLRLRGLCRGTDFLLPGLFPADKDVLADRGAEQLIFLWDRCDAFPQILQFIIPDIDSVHLHRSLRRIVEPADQTDQAGLSASGGSDDAKHLAGTDLQIDVMEHLRLVIGIGECHVPETYTSLFRCLPHSRAVCDGGLGPEDLIKTAAGGEAAGEGLKDHGQHHHAVQDLGNIGDGRHHVTGTDGSGSRLNPADPDQRHDGHVQDDIHDGAHETRQDQHPHLRFHQFRIGFIKSPGLCILLNEGSYHTGSGDVFSNHRIHPVDPFLKDRKQRIGLPQDKDDIQNDQRERTGHNNIKMHIQGQEREGPRNEKHGRADQPPNDGHHQPLHLGNIIGDTGDEGSGGEGIRLFKRHPHDSGKTGFPHLIAIALSADVGHGGTEDAKQSPCQHDQKHADPHRGNKSNIRSPVSGEPQDAVIHDARHQFRLDHVRCHFSYHEEGRQQRKDPVFFHVSEHSSLLPVRFKAAVQWLSPAHR